MIDITLQNFEAELIFASQQRPVLLDIWAPWCGPCRTLGPMLEKLEEAYDGRFTLAKLNSDEVPEIATQLSQMFGVRSIPFCVMFVGGQPVDGFVGALPEAQIREFLDKHVPAGEALAAEAEVEEAESLLAEGDVDAALAKLAHAVEMDPANEAARFDLVKALLEAGRTEAARAVFDPVAALAADTITPHARFAALAVWLSAAEAPPADAAALQAAIAANRRDFDARFALAMSALAAQRFTDAMDELLEIIMRDKTWNGEAARKAYVAILELLTKPAPKVAAEAKSGGTLEIAGRSAAVQSDPLIDGYRRKLSMALF
ncbi:MAG: co-chaperone YbbN [Roseateles depolymerans]|uniref:Co-chaperone YbbN n=1 Tax=Roseateles depolymerans TaxID=76731 RepID=A0A2W5FTG5_9BURK|nr:MAG: co-chaperone YbbN [Roseateles depolymerans]